MEESGWTFTVTKFPICFYKQNFPISSQKVKRFVIRFSIWTQGNPIFSWNCSMCSSFHKQQIWPIYTGQNSLDYMERKAVEKQQAVILLFMYMYVTLNIWGVSLCLCLFQMISRVGEEPLSPFRSSVTTMPPLLLLVLYQVHICLEHLDKLKSFNT